MAEAMKQINFSVPERVFAALERRAAEHGYRATAYAKMLFEAAFASRVGVSPDRHIDDQIRIAVVMHGARQDTATIAKASGLSEATIVDVLDAWKLERRAALNDRQGPLPKA